MTPRTACTAVGDVLITQLGGEYLPKVDLLNNKREFVLQKKHCTLQQLLDHKVITDKDIDGLYVFTTVRNHYDSLYSLYMKQKIKYVPLLEDESSWVYKIPGYVETIKYCQNHTFDEWFKKNYGVPWYKILVDKGHQTIYADYIAGASYIMKFENLQEDFNYVLKQVGINDPIMIPRINETGVKLHDSYRGAFSDSSKRLFKYVFKKEMKIYGYKF